MCASNNITTRLSIFIYAISQIFAKKEEYYDIIGIVSITVYRTTINNYVIQNKKKYLPLYWYSITFFSVLPIEFLVKIMIPATNCALKLNCKLVRKLPFLLSLKSTNYYSRNLVVLLQCCVKLTIWYLH